MKSEINSAVVNARSLPISTKYSVEICNFIRYKDLKTARKQIENIVEMKKALPIRRFGWDLGHKKEVGPGTYPVKAGKHFLQLLDSAKSNAENKGLNGENLVITIAKANKAERRWRAGRKGRVKMKNTHVTIKVEEIKKENLKEGNKK
ncbi:50S ribosomal protein L22 [Candidatus Woesearchaeota archaeon]|nr:50S ribosomal protein L22P [uncultured archaeon]MBS3175156.1 50S ribosomal protein L22 [Candidatus Woesearchaeota archaeon]